MSDVQCEQHGGTIRNADHEFVCCIQEQYAVDSYAGKSTEATPPPPGLRAQVAALLNAPAYDRPATTDGATREGDRR